MRKILYISGIILAIAIVLAVSVWALRQPRNEVCRELHIRITPPQESFVSESEIRTLLRQNDLDPIGQPMEQVQLQAIEDRVTSHAMVRRAQCYRHGDASVRLLVEQRHPLLRVVTATESYFVDSDRQRMPIRAGIQSDAIHVTGHVGERMAKEELADLVEWLQDNSFWQPRIRRIEVREGKQIVLHQKTNEPRILIGTVENFEKKMHKVRIYIEETIAQSYDFPNYRELDARFDGQVVGRK